MFLQKKKKKRGAGGGEKDHRHFNATGQKKGLLYSSTVY